MKYFLMRKDDVITTLEFSDDGNLLKWSHEIQNEDQAPLLYKFDKNSWIKKWWNEREVAFDGDRLQKMLSKAGYSASKEYLIDNLGLSLNDYYWVKPVDSNLTWNNVNLFSNPFAEDLFVKVKMKSKTTGTSTFTPNASLQGQIEKTWSIKNGKRILIKGNLDDTSQECINEVFASLLHQKQGYINYVPYKLVKIKDRSYVYGCQSECFTDEQNELVTAWAVLNSKKAISSKNHFERFISICEDHGIDGIELRRNLDYMIMTDYILSNRDRHLNNIGILRNSKSLKFEKMAPIYDTGRSMFIRRYDLKLKDIINGKVNSFYSEEEKMLSLVHNKTLVDISQLPNEKDITSLYQKDPSLSTERIEKICEWYNIKVKAFERWQNGG